MATKHAEGRMMSDREHERHLLFHRARLQNMRAHVDNGPPPQYSHLMLRMKQLQNEEHKKSEIDRENKILLQRMSAIMMARNSSQPHFDTLAYQRRVKTMSLDRRQKEHDRLMADNLVIAKRIERTRPFYDVGKWEEDHKHRQQLLTRWAKGRNGSPYRSSPTRSPPRRSPRQSKQRSQPSDRYESDFESDSEDERDRKQRKDKLPPIKSV